MLVSSLGPVLLSPFRRELSSCSRSGTLALTLPEREADRLRLPSLLPPYVEGRTANEREEMVDRDTDEPDAIGFKVGVRCWFPEEV